jgi:MFS family permease
VQPAPRIRYTILDLTRQITERRFLIPTAVLAASTGALGTAIGFLPALATRHGLDPIAGTAAVTVLAIASAAVQPRVGKLRDGRAITDSNGMKAGLLMTSSGIGILSLAPGSITVFVSAVLIGAGVGIATPLAFAHLADTTPSERMGRTMGSAELGRELGDAGGPLLVGSLAALVGLPLGLGALALLIAAAAAPRLGSKHVLTESD